MIAIQRYWQDLRWLLLIFTLALVIRVAFVLWINPDIHTGRIIDDASFYHGSARALADGRGYIFPGRGAPTAYWPPGYSGLLSSVYLLPGPDIIAGRLLNAFLGAAGCGLLFVVGRLMGGRTVGIVAGLLLAFFPSHVFYSARLLTEVTYATLLTGIVLLFVWALRRGPTADSRVPLLLGLALGAATLVRGEGVLLPLVFGAVWWLSGRSLKRGAQFAGIAFLGLAIILGGWTIRNVIQLGAPVPISTGSTINLALSHWEGADGGSNKLRYRAASAYYQELPYPEREVKESQKQLREALAYMFTHPGHELSLIPRRLFWLYRNDHAAVDWIAHKELSVGEGTLDRLSTLSDAYYFTVLVLGMLGLWLWWRTRREFALLLASIILYVSALTGVILFGDPRFHASLIPIICLLAAPTVVAARDAASAARRRHQARRSRGAVLGP